MAKKILFMIIFMIIPVIGSDGFSQNCPNLEGIWDFTYTQVLYDSISNDYSFIKSEGNMYVIEQKECLFYGFFEFPNDPNAGCFLNGVSPFTGSIGNKISNKEISIIITSCDTTLIGILIDRKTKDFLKKIEFTFSNVREKIWSSGKGSATKRINIHTY